MMTRNHIFFFAVIVLLAGCTKSEIEVAEKPERVITIEIDESEVVKLDGKEIHISFLENQMAALAEDFEVVTEIKVNSGATTGVVTDVTTATRGYTARFITHTRAVLK